MLACPCPHFTVCAFDILPLNRVQKLAWDIVLPVWCFPSDFAQLLLGLGDGFIQCPLGILLLL